MLANIGIYNNSNSDLDSDNKLNTIQFTKYNIRNTLIPNEKTNTIFIQNGKKPISLKENNKDKNNDYSLNTYQLIKTKALKYVNTKNNNKTIKKIIKLNKKNKNISPVKRKDETFVFNTSQYSNNPINNIKIKSRNLSQSKIISNNNYENNYNNYKGIKEIRIKSKKKLSQISHALLANKINNSINSSGEETIITLSNMSGMENNNNIIFNNYTKFLQKPKIGIYSRKRMKSYKSLSMDKKSVNRIETIEIDFGPKKYGNSRTEKKNNNNFFNITKIIMIQRYFRNYLEMKYKIIQDKISLGIRVLIKYIKNYVSYSMKMIFVLYKKKLPKKKKTKYYVNKNQYEMLKILREKNIRGMMQLKIYLAKLFRNKKF
jgi:hypothetical protein